MSEAKCEPPARSSQRCESGEASHQPQHQVEDEMLRKLMKKSCKLYDELQEEKRITEDAQLRDAIKANRLRIQAQVNQLILRTSPSYHRVSYSLPEPADCLPTGDSAAGVPVPPYTPSCSSSSSLSTLSSASTSTTRSKWKEPKVRSKSSRPQTNRSAPDYKLPPVSQLPSAAHYIYTPRNVLVEDQKALPNIPYFDDVTASEENPFLKEVISCYGNRIHSESRIKSDEQLVQMVDRMFKTPGATSCKIFEAISCAFQDEGTKEDVKRRYDRAKEFRGATAFCPNIDSDTAISCSRDRSLHSFKTLFCRRCLMYDCLLHSAEMDIPQEKVVKMMIRNRDNFQDTFQEEKPTSCSQSCYLLRRDYGLPGVAYAELKLPPAAESIIRCEWPSSAGNFCFLKQVVNDESVSCSKIYYWCQQEFENFNHVVRDSFKLGSQVSATQNGQTYITVKIDDDEEHDENSSNGAVATNGQVIRPKRKKGQTKGWTKKKNKYTTWQMKAATAQSQVAPGTVHNYTPCLDHSVCSAETCNCIQKGHFCEKYCLCSNCPYKFPGCNCNGTCNTKQCPCFAASRECDPDLCKVCGSGDIPEPKKCTNVDLQRMYKKHLLVAPSDLGPDAGWGCYLKEKCVKNDLISEYVGEQISQSEADRRGLIYDRKKHSFLFCLNSDFSIDATRYGNKIRFANHSVNPNCFAKIMKVNGEHRIGIYAKRDIDEGEELFFDYKYGPNERIEFVPIESSAPVIPSLRPQAYGIRGLKTEKL